MKKKIIITSMIVTAILITTFTITTNTIPQESYAGTCTVCKGNKEIECTNKSAGIEDLTELKRGTTVAETKDAHGTASDGGTCNFIENDQTNTSSNNIAKVFVKCEDCKAEGYYYTGSCTGCGAYYYDDHKLTITHDNIDCETCEGTGEVCSAGGAHEMEETPAYDSENHWNKCKNCTYTTEPIGHTMKLGACVACPYECQHTDSSGQSTFSYVYNNDETHTITCTLDCKYQDIKDCELGPWEQLTVVQQHARSCKYCTNVKYGPHDTSGANGECSACGYIAHQHSYTSKVVAPTCTDGGYTEYTCSCGDTYKDSETNATGHSWQAYSKAAKCAETGESGDKCTVCGETQNVQTIPAQGHDWKPYTNAATCSNEGESGDRCTRCNETQNKQTIPTIPHSWQTYTNAATCTTAGESGDRCTACNATQNIQTIPATGHSWQTYTNAPTCTENGSSGEKCSVCDIIQNEQTIPATGHSWQTYTNAATCTENGSSGEKCSTCGVIQNEQTIPATGHNVTQWTDNGNGTHSGTCTECEEPQTQDCKFGDDNVCTICGATKNTECEHNYEIDRQGATETQHWEKCTKCREKRNTETHIFNNGKCTVCEYECSHSNKTDKKDATHHWNECTNCKKVLEKETHTYVEGKCECGAIEPQEECKHENKTDKKDNTYHWEECVDCGEIIGKEKHKYVDAKCECGATEPQEECKHENKTDKKDNTYHWKECVDCGEITNKEKHKYEDGKCECGKQEEIKECTHENREWTAKKDEHYQICKDCGSVIEGTTAKHVFVDGKCKNCKALDTTTTTTKIPDTGATTIVVAVVALGILTVAGAIKLKKYKDI